MKAQDLKNSILQLAIQGKLVKQDTNDEPAEVLYAKIQAEKQKLIKEGKIKKDKPLPPITDDEIPFAIPSTWKWVRLGDIAVINGGFAFKSTQYKDSGIRVIRISDFDENGFKNNKIVRYNYTDDLEQYLIEKNNIIMAMTGGTVGKSYFVSDLSEKMVSNQRVATIKINSKANSEYINIVILAPVIQKLIQISKNSTNDNISMDLINNFPVPLPPLAEQKRIVTKIEELEPLVKQYDKAETELSVLNNSFPEQLKKLILQYAIQGKLVPQDTNDEPAEVLYAKIQAEKQKLIKEGKIKKDKLLPPITDDEIPFEIPSTWKWVRLGSISNYSSAKKKISPNQIEPEMWSLDLEDIEKGTGRVLKKCFAKDRIIRGEKVCFTKGNILYSKLRPYLLKILIADDDGITTPELVPFNFYGDSYQQFFLWYLKSPYVDSIVNSESYGVKMPRVGTDTMLQLLVPLPPLAEQKRIVAKINELLQYCEKLK